MKKRILTAAVLLACIFTGCGAKKEESSALTGQTETAASTAAAPEEETATQTALPARETEEDADIPVETERTDLPETEREETAEPDVQNPAEAEAEPVEEIPPAEETPVGDGPTVGFERDIYVSPGQEHVPVTVRFYNNPGFTVCGIRIRFGGDLLPNLLTEDYAAEYELGEAGEGLLASCSASAEKHAAAFVAMASQPCTASGDLFTCFFDIPADLRPGSKIPLKIEISDLADADGNSFGAEIRNASVIVE